MNKKWLPHIIAVGAFAALIVLGLACASTPEEIAEREAKEKAQKEAQQEALRQYFLKFDEYAVGALGGDAVYWKNREVFKLPRVGVGAAGEIATSIVVSGNDVYIAGEILYSQTTFEAVYWKNGKAVILPRGSARLSQATSIQVSGNDVYVTGSVGVDAVYWKNGQLVKLTELTEKNNEAVANAVAIVGNDVYVAGCLNGTAVYWRNNGQLVTLRSDSGGAAEAIAISGNNVYVAGWAGNRAVLWTNGQAAILPGNGIFPLGGGKGETREGGGIARANSIFVSGADVYVGGYANYRYAKDVEMGATYWKNGVRTVLRIGGEDYGTSVFAIDDSVYVGGYVCQTIWDTNVPPGVKRKLGERNIATLWINKEGDYGQRIFIGPNEPVTVPTQVVNSVIRGIYVVKK